MTKFIAFYLPQFYPIPENNLWWGNGFTDWNCVVKAKKLFIGHQQPNYPADLGFYDLRLSEVREAQANLAQEAGISAFCYWHYWFGNGKQLLERPFNEVLSSGVPKFPFCLAWANHSWEKKLWDKNGTSEMLLEQKYYGEKDYIAHFNSLLPAFRDNRYLKVGEKLFFIIYDPIKFDDVSSFIHTWRNLAKVNGLNDFYFVATDFDCRNRDEILSKGFDATYNNDVFNIHHRKALIKKIVYYVGRNVFGLPTVFSYKNAIKYMVTEDCRLKNVIPVIAPNWDHSPRSGKNSIILHKPKPKYFKEIAKFAIDIVKDKPSEEQIIMIKSWNEWGEGNYMEPDQKYGKGYIYALREAIEESKINIG